MTLIKALCSALATVLILAGLASVGSADFITIEGQKVQILIRNGELQKFDQIQNRITIDEQAFEFNSDTRFLGPDGTVLGTSQAIMDYSPDVKLRYYFKPKGKEGEDPVLLSIQIAPPQ